MCISPVCRWNYSSVVANRRKYQPDSRFWLIFLTVFIAEPTLRNLRPLFVNNSELLITRDFCTELVPGWYCFIVYHKNTNRPIAAVPKYRRNGGLKLIWLKSSHITRF